MGLSVQECLIYMMVVTAASDSDLSDSELNRIGVLVERLPAFRGFDTDRLPGIAAKCIDLLQEGTVELVLHAIVDDLPAKFQDTAYYVAVEVAAADLALGQEELRWLEMVRDYLKLDRLVTAAIETAARARLRHL
ncbi:MAG: tellurite resistance TerB family protein [Hyphomicrobiaceae bacterium]|nr:tellurite resistance TerB family protein [Hyphomicrobiaceae bacterium]